MPDPRLSILTNLYLSDPSLPFVSYEEEKKEETSQRGEREKETSGASPPSSASTSPLNPEAEPFVPVNIPHLKAFSAPTSPELDTPSMEPIRPEILATLRSVFDNDNEQARPDNVTRRRLDMEAEAGENPRHLGPLPQDFSTAPVTGVKRRRTLTTSSCGPDLQHAMVQLVAARLNNTGEQCEITQHYEDYILGSQVGVPVSGGAVASPESDLQQSPSPQRPPSPSPQMKLRSGINLKRPRHQ